MAASDQTSLKPASRSLAHFQRRVLPVYLDDQVQRRRDAHLSVE
ncbi:MAG: hypothetical protein ACE5R6_18045 [Candidatus Heimdallarchaeota archaeon]